MVRTTVAPEARKPHALSKIASTTNQKAKSKASSSTVVKATKRPFSNEWDAFDTRFLKDLATTKTVPTRFVSEPTFTEYRLWEDMQALFKSMGLGNLHLMVHDTHEKYMREFLASVRVIYEDEKNPVASQGCLSFIINKKFYSMSLNELCNIYGFNQGNYSSKKAKQTMIRNPVLRCAAKVISHTFCGKAETTAITEGELWMLFEGVKHLLTDENGEPYPSGNDFNYGDILSTKFLTYKKEIHIRGMITPILEYHKIDLQHSPPLTWAKFIDEAYLVHCHILSGPLKIFSKYCFEDREGRPLFYSFISNFHHLNSHKNLEFLPAPELLCQHSHRVRCRNASIDTKAGETPHVLDRQPDYLLSPLPS
ncbi:unnamed protein product [Arabis nemorensis]|uniref:Arabidopsis retrotransposon Orf1 C-terminal domain-containing protein n=1 Tax=Arabis nemorensis TaxID=586526 RepID=A0A565BJR2_9BRAS|nr:unnamed protein product [Arabis nemorensis]